MKLTTKILRSFLPNNEPENDQGKKVLIIDSDQFVANRIKSAIQSIENQCIGIANDFLSADKMINKHQPHYIIINSVLKGEFNAMQTAKIISLDYDIPFLLVGSLKDPSFLQTVNELNPRGHLLLDYTNKDLEEKLEEILV